MKLENVGNNRNAAYLVVEYKWFLSHISVELCEQQVKVKNTVLSLHDNCLIYKSCNRYIPLPASKLSRGSQGYGGGGGMRGRALRKSLLVGYNYVPMFSQLAAASSSGLFLACSRRSDSGEGAGKRENTTRDGVRRSRENKARGGVKKSRETQLGVG